MHQIRYGGEIRGYPRYRDGLENVSASFTESRFLVGHQKTGQSKARTPKRGGAFDRRKSTAPHLFRSGARAYKIEIYRRLNQGSIIQQDDYTLFPLPSCSMNGVHF